MASDDALTEAERELAWHQSDDCRNCDCDTCVLLRALVAQLHEDGSGVLHLCDRVPEGSRGQSRLRFETAPYEVTALNGLSVWGGASQIMLGDAKIADRIGYTKISFIERDGFLAAVAAYHQRKRQPAGEGGRDGE